MADWRWYFWHTERVRELGVVAHLGSDLDRIFMTGSDLAHRPGLPALSSLPHHLHALCLGLRAVVAQYRQDDVFGAHNGRVPTQTALYGLQYIVAGAGALRRGGGELQPYLAGSS